MRVQERSDSIMHARLTHDIKVLVLTESDVTDSVLLQDVMNFMRGDVVSVRLPSLTGSSVFNDMFAHIMNRSKYLPHLIGQSTSVVCQALQNSYEVAISHVPNTDSCTAYHLWLQIKVFFEAKLHESQKLVDDEKVFADVEKEQMQIVFHFIGL